MSDVNAKILPMFLGFRAPDFAQDVSVREDASGMSNEQAEQGGRAFPIEIARPMHTRTRVENNIFNQMRDCLLAENLHCALVHWQALSRRMAGLTVN
jgi:hypothetical protein